MPSIPLFKVLVNDLDEAVGFYTSKLGMSLLEDKRLGNYRWVLVGYPEQPGFGINLDLATTEEEKALVGRQAAGLPMFSFMIRCPSASSLAASALAGPLISYTTFCSFVDCWSVFMSGSIAWIGSEQVIGTVISHGHGVSRT